jgi:hypothetical protein
MPIVDLHREEPGCASLVGNLADLAPLGTSGDRLQRRQSGVEMWMEPSGPGS